MSVSRVTRIILKTHKPLQLLSAFLGCLIGFLLIITSLQSYISFNHIFNDKEQSIGSQYLVINKDVSLLSLANLSKTSFTKSQITELETLPSVKRVSSFIPNQFTAFAEMHFEAGNNGVAMKTDLFLESVNDSFVDVVSDNWHWSEGEQTVPIILPADFINLYNFTYAPARGLPQLSKNSTKLFKFQLSIDNHGTDVVYYGEIAGFSNRISSMIVPMSFMNFANSHYGTMHQNNDVFRLIVEVEPSQMGAFQQFLSERGYVTNDELLKSGKISSLMQAVMAILLILGGVMIFNAFSGFLLYLQLVIARSQYELETLLRLGYRHSKLTAWYANSLGICLLSIGMIGYGLLLCIHESTKAFMLKNGFEIPQYISIHVVTAGLSLMVLLYLIFFLVVRRQIYKLALPAK